MIACGGSILMNAADLDDSFLRTCQHFEESQIGGHLFDLFKGCPQAKTFTIIIRVLEETERSLQDAIMNFRRAKKNDAVVASGVAIEMELLKQHHEISNTNAGKELMHISAITQSAINIQPQSQLKKEWIHECEKIEEEKEEVKQQSIDDVIHQGFLDNTEYKRNIGEKDRERYVLYCTGSEKDFFKAGINSAENFKNFEKITLQVTGTNLPQYITSFKEAGLCPLFPDNIKKAGYVKPTPIQKGQSLH
uniref:RNA helicase n=1 Tax=Daphnia galeata TaxID=27404 RepID=A0A8J2S1Z0_9CRUS|nr:unnamed protein product [Daphnia galeata]